MHNACTHTHTQYDVVYQYVGPVYQYVGLVQMITDLNLIIIMTAQTVLENEICDLFADRVSSSTLLSLWNSHWQWTPLPQWSPHQTLSLHCLQNPLRRRLTRLKRKRSVVVYFVVLFIITLAIAAIWYCANGIDTICYKTALLIHCRNYMVCHKNIYYKTLC